MFSNKNKCKYKEFNNLTPMLIYFNLAVDESAKKLGASLQRLEPGCCPSCDEDFYGPADNPTPIGNILIYVKNWVGAKNPIYNFSPTGLLTVEHFYIQHKFNSRTEPNEELLALFREFFESLANETIYEMDFSDNIIEPVLIDEFKQMFVSAGKLKILNFENSRINQQNAVFIGKCLCDLENKESVEAINLARNMIFTIPQDLIDGISGCTNLKDLRLEKNVIKDDSISLLVEQLTDKPIEILDLRFNKLNKDACRALGKLFSKRFIKELCISNCEIKSEDFKEFLQEVLNKSQDFDKLKRKTHKFSKTSFDLSSNCIEDDCMPLLVEFCKKYDIGELFLYSNRIKDCQMLNEVLLEKGGHVYSDKNGIKFQRNEETFGIKKNKNNGGFGPMKEWSDEKIIY